MNPTAFAGVFSAMDRRLEPSSRAPVTLALSGGSDSLGLLVLAKAWAERVGRPLHALTVDHGLHADSGCWTRAAGEAAARLGVPWRALSWLGPKPSSGLPNASRTARHALLAGATKAAGACVLLVGHTADDVDESELIRLASPTHGHLAEWSPSPVWPEGRGVFLLRPLLQTRRADLQTMLSTAGIAWLDDPGNGDLRFARGRARRALIECADTGSAERTTVAGPRRGLPLCDARWLDSICAPDGAINVPIAWLTAMNRPADGLARMLTCASGGSRPPRRDALGRLLRRLTANEAITATLSGARLDGCAGSLRVTRELGRAHPAPMPLHPGATQVFDGRFELHAQAWGWQVVPLSGRAARLSRLDRRALEKVRAGARPGLPALIGPHGEIRLPQPFGAGPATAVCLVGSRLAAALGLTRCERALRQAQEPRQTRGADPPLVLS